ncbi:MAG: DUF6383 domain-containing protein [Bacteroidia bacterium]|nr:DUF6383 domain-containing protein [Bacteroidia bacterium]
MSIKKLLLVLITTLAIHYPAIAQESGPVTGGAVRQLEYDPTTNICTIYEAIDLHYLSEHWEDGGSFPYENYNFKIADGIEEIDLSAWHSNIQLKTEFDGNGATIKFTNITDDTATGLFQCLYDKAYVHDLNIVGEIQSSGNSDNAVQCGILCNVIYLIDEQEPEVKIKNVTTDGYIKGNNITYSGGIAAMAMQNTINLENVINKAHIEATHAAGGLIGNIGSSTTSIMNCANVGTIALRCPNRVDNVAIGGLVGLVNIGEGNQTYTLSIENCYNRGSIYSKAEDPSAADNNSLKYSMGMLVGYSQIDVSLTNTYCYFDGEFSFDNEAYPAGIYYLGERINNVRECNIIINDETINENTPITTTFFSGTNVFYYNEYAGDAEKSHYVSKESIQSGEIAYRLNNGQEKVTENGEDIDTQWHQILNSYPVLAFEGGQNVYKHGDEYNFLDHNYINGICYVGCYEKPLFDGNFGFIISNPGHLRWLNENWDTDEVLEYRNFDIHFGKINYPDNWNPEGSDSSIDDITFSPVTIDLTNDEVVNNWSSKINIASNVYGHGSTIKFKSNDNGSADYRCTGLFRSIEDNVNEKIEITDLTIVGSIYDYSDTYKGGYTGLLADEVKLTTAQLEVRNIKLSGGISNSSDYIGTLFGGIFSQGDNEVTANINNVISYADINSGSTMGGLIGSSTCNYVNITFCAHKGTLYYYHYIPHNANITHTVGSMIGTSASTASIEYCYTTSNYENTDYFYRGSFIGHQSPYNGASVKNCFTYFGTPNVDASTKINYYMYPVGNAQQTTSSSDENSNSENEQDTKQDPKEELLRLMIDRESNIYYYSTRLDSIMQYQLRDYFSKGNVIGYIIGENEDVRNLFSQQLYANDNTPFEYFPRFSYELVANETQYTVYPTCSENHFSNIDRRKKNDDNEFEIVDGKFVYEHVFSDKTHLCIYCNAIDEDYFADNSEVIIEDTDDLTSMTDIVSTLTQAGIAADITVTNNIVYTDVEYSDLSTDALETILPDKQSIGTSEAPFKGTFNGESGDFVNFAFKQNGLFNYVGEEGTVSGLSIVNGVVLNDLSGEDVVKEDDGTIYAAALANVNEGNIEYSSFVGAMAIPDDIDQEKVNFCLVGENKGSVSYSFAYFTNLDEVKDKLNKAAIIIKGNYGVGRGTAGQTKKVASNSASNSAITDDPYYTPSDSELTKGERTFSNEEFASGVVAYWMNFEDEGYQGTYTCKYRQGVLTPELSNNGEDAVHKIIYQSNKSTATVTGKAYENSGSTLIITLSEPALSVKIGDTEAVLTADNTRATINVPVTTEADVTVNVTFAGATAIDTITPDAKANVVVADGRLMVFGAEGQNITIFNTNGNIVYSTVVTSNRVDLPVISRGIYFVKVGNHTTKIVF